MGDRSANVRAHARIPAVIDALLRRDGIALDAYWIATADVAACDLARFDAIWLVPGSPYDSPDGAMAAVRTAATAPSGLSYGLPGTSQMASNRSRSHAATSGVAIQ